MLALLPSTSFVNCFGKLNSATGDRGTAALGVRPTVLDISCGAGSGITAPAEEEFEKERFRRAHYYPVSLALRQGYSSPWKQQHGGYQSARELHTHRTQHIRLEQPPQQRYGALPLARRPVGRQPPLTPHLLTASCGGALGRLHGPATHHRW
jgi:hypothetical protein